MRWIRVHKLPDYAYFAHRVHVAAGIGCVTCHGRIDEMETVTQIAPLSMSWCLDCHRNPGPNRRPLGGYQHEGAFLDVEHAGSAQRNDRSSAD
jgi:hypothetical protein